MPSFYGAIDLLKNELRNAAIQNLGSAPATPVLGQLYYNTADQTLYYCTNVVGPVWTAAKAAAGATPASTVTTSAVGDSAVVGVGTNYARDDHKHGREAFGAITAQTAFGGASGNGSAATLARSDHTHGTPTHDAAAHSTIKPHDLAVPTANVSWNGQKIINLSDPSSPLDAVNKQYVDGLVQGLSWKDSVRVASTVNIAALTGLLTVDGITVSANDRVLIKNQTSSATNGIYVAAAGAWARATDADAAGELEGMACYVHQGTTQANTSWLCTASIPITVGSTPLTFSQFAGGSAITSGAGMTGTTTFDVVAGDTSLTVSADSLIVNTAVIATVASVASAVSAKATKYAAALTGTASPETVTHNLNTRDIMLTVYNGATPYTAVEVDWDATTVNTAVIRYSPNLGAGYRVVVLG